MIQERIHDVQLYLRSECIRVTQAYPCNWSSSGSYPHPLSEKKGYCRCRPRPNTPNIQHRMRGNREYEETGFEEKNEFAYRSSGTHFVMSSPRQP